MPRVINEQEYATRRNEILDAAQHLIYTRGYESMSIQDILNALGISKGAFYHYFDSKQALLNALIVRLQGEAELVMTPIVADPSLPTLAKLERFFDTIAGWKNAKKEYLLPLLRVWYNDTNALVRQRLMIGGVSWFAPYLNQIICQGGAEGVMHVSHPERTGEVVIRMMVNLGDALAWQFLALGERDGPPPHNSGPPPQNSGPPAGGSGENNLTALNSRVQEMEETLAAYTSAIERVLGLPAESLRLFDKTMLREWAVSFAEKKQYSG